ncbi:MAG TPA: DUF3455 domain-containing protein [Polyangia bacterium]|jgi:hypothetical protein|nr:DUF3455 domain-containing protein [Polyangia bacterium]
MIAKIVLALVLSKAAADAPLTPPVVPAAIQVPAGAKLARKFHATGAQVYTCAAPAPGGTAPFAWTLKRPDATLFDAAGAKAGTHGAGPTWTATDGSAVVGQKAAQADAPAPNAIPWLLVRATSNTGKGVFSAVTFVQRLDTKGGKAPATGCDAKTVGAETRVDYSADYFFFEKDAAAK